MRHLVINMLRRFRMGSGIAAGLLGATLVVTAGQRESARSHAEAKPERPPARPTVVSSPRTATEAVALSAIALHHADPEGRHRGLVVETAAQLLLAQWDETRGIAPCDLRYGGIGPYADAPPDLWHTALAVEAFRCAGFAHDDPSIVRASRFVSECQVGESRSQPGDSQRGGFTAAPCTSDPADGNAAAPTGLWTAAGLHALHLSGATPDDPRIRDGIAWLAHHYTLAANPGARPARRHLFEFYMIFSRAMTVLEVDYLIDRHGLRHDWREELAALLVAQQRSDGSWVNPEEAEDPENSRPLATTYFAMMTLAQIQRSAPPADGPAAPADAPSRPRAPSNWFATSR